MRRKTRTTLVIITGLSALTVILLLAAGCVAIPAAQTAPVPTTQVIQSSVTPLPSLCTSVEVQSSPSDAFRLKILVKNSAGKPAPGAKVDVTFDNSDGPARMRTDDHGYAFLELHDKDLVLPDAHGRTSGTLRLFIFAVWGGSNGDAEYLTTCASQEIDLLAPSEIAVTVNLPP